MDGDFLVIDDQGLVYANPAKTELIGVVPNFAGNDFSGGFANIVIPASVKAITGYVNVTPATGTAAATTGTNHGAFENMTSLTNVTFASNNVADNWWQCLQRLHKLNRSESAKEFEGIWK